MKSLGNYLDIYLKADVLLLADVFEKFISTCLQYYGLDPCHYFSSPGLSWDAMLKITKIILKLVSDIDKHLFIETGMRKGISYNAKIYSKANNKCMTDYAVVKKVYTLFIYTQTIYMFRGMSQYLPYRGFKWLNQKEFDKFDVNAFEKNSSNGYILEVDLEYLDELHELVNDIH